MKTLERNRTPAALAALVMATLAGTAAAGSLQVTTASGNATASGAYTVTVRNAGSATVNGIRVMGDLGHDLSCQNLTTAGQPFAMGGALAAGDGVTCSARTAVAGGVGASAVFTATGSAAGKAVQGATTVSRVQAATFDQAAVQVVGGAIHNDSSVDGKFDAGESVDYSYTVVNLGTLDLNAVTVTDSYVATEGAVTCPATTLAVGAAMKCTRTHAITAADAAAAAAGGFTNTVDVVATASNGAPAASQDTVIRVNLGGSVYIHGFKQPLLLTDADNNGVAGVGDTVEYHFTVKNAGSQPLTQVNITEPDPSRIDTPIVCSATTLDGATFGALGSAAAALAPSDSVLCTATYVVTAADKTSPGGQVRNTAELSAMPNFGNEAVETISSALVMPPPPLPDYVEVPVNSKWMLLALFGFLGLIGVGRLAWRRS